MGGYHHHGEAAVGIAIDRALPSHAEGLTRLAHAATRHWRYAEEEQLRAEGATTLRIESDPNAEGFYLKAGARRAGEVASTPPGRMLPVLVLTRP